MPHSDSETQLPARRARLFRNGRNQAVRIPREFELTAKEVIIYKEDEHLIVVPVRRKPELAEVLSKLAPLDVEFPVIADPVVQPEDFL